MSAFRLSSVIKAFCQYGDGALLSSQAWFKAYSAAKCWLLDKQKIEASVPRRPRLLTNRMTTADLSQSGKSPVHAHTLQGIKADSMFYEELFAAKFGGYLRFCPWSQRRVLYTFHRIPFCFLTLLPCLQKKKEKDLLCIQPRLSKPTCRVSLFNDCLNVLAELLPWPPSYTWRQTQVNLISNALQHTHYVSARTTHTVALHGATKRWFIL